MSIENQFSLDLQIGEEREDFAKRVGRSLREARLNQGLTIAELARMADLDPSTISRSERGRVTSNKTILSLIKALKINESEFLGADYATTDSFKSTVRTRRLLATKELASVVRTLMDRSRLSKDKLARDAGISRSSLDRILSGRSQHVAEKTVMNLAEALNVSFSELLELASPKEGRAAAAENLAAQIPDQNSVVRFGVSSQNKLKLVASPHHDDNHEAIDSFRDELLAPGGPLDALRDHYAAHRNTPQAGLFADLIERYHTEISKPYGDINFATLFARGARVFAARSASEKMVASGEWPDPDADEASAIDSVCSIHGPLMMASFVGRQLIADAHMYEAPQDTYETETKVIARFGDALAADTALIEQDSAAALTDLTEPIANDPQPARSRGMRLVLTGSLLSSIVGGVAWLSLGGATSAGIASIGTGIFAWEVLKQTKSFRELRDGLAEQYDKVSDGIASNNDQIELLRKMKALVEREAGLFRKIADLRPEFEWIKKFLPGSDKPKN